MAEKQDLILEKPVSFLSSVTIVNYRDFFASLGKAAVTGAFGDTKGTLEYGVDALKEIGSSYSPEQAAWTLVSTALMRALTILSEDSQDLFDSDIDEASLSELAGRVEYTLKAVTVSIDADFFNRPQDLAFLEDFKSALMFWLKELGLNDFQAQAFHERLKGEFTLALHDQWSKYPDTYECIEQQLNTPFTKATLEEKAWRRYNLTLQNKANSRVFGEAFGLRRIYIPLRAYYDEKSCEKEETNKIVCDLHGEIANWLGRFDKNNALRVVSGGPGCGKSSFAKTLAADLGEKQEVPVLFIPLHYFNLTDDLIQAVGSFAQVDHLSNPLTKETRKERLLLIFDGLDELSMQGKAANDVALQFIDELSRLLDRHNDNGCRWQAIVTGRDLSIQASEQRLRKKQQILHILPYYLSETEKQDYHDKEGLLATDQRNLWWDKFGQAKGKHYSGIPKEIATESLSPITREPLLNYLLSLSYERKTIEFNDKTSLNNIYYDLLIALHERQYAGHQHEASQDLKFDEFLQILEEIAIAVWHGNGRTASESYLYNRCKESGLTRHLENFSEGAKKGVVRLLTAFYFRQFGTESTGDRTFEFTHKSFGEYLTARRIVGAVEDICEDIKRNQSSPRKGRNPQEALEDWIKIVGSTAIDSYLFRFIRDEISQYDSEKIQYWQETTANLLGIVVREGSPMESIGLPNFTIMMQHSRNAEEALLGIHYACALNTLTVSHINWGQKTNFGVWFKRIQGQRIGSNNPLLLKSLAYIDLSDQIIHNSDLYGANLTKSIFSGTGLIYSTLANAKIDGAILIKAIIRGANLRNANLFRGDFKEADLSNSRLDRANLQETNFENAELRETYLTDSMLVDSNLKGADLTNANLERANLKGAILTNARLKGANSERANLQGIDLEGVNLEGANFERANLEGANLAAVNLKKANFKGANFKGANLEGATFKKSRIEGSNLNEANLKNTILEKESISQYIWNEGKTLKYLKTVTKRRSIYSKE